MTLNSAPSPYTQSSHLLQAQPSNSSAMLPQSDPFRAVGEISLAPSSVASPSYIRPSILAPRPAPGDPFSGLIQVNTIEVPNAGNRFSNLIELHSLPSSPPPPPRKRRRGSLANPPPVDPFMSLSEIHMAPSTPPPSSVQPRPLYMSIPLLGAHDAIEGCPESYGHSVAITTSPAQPSTSTRPTLPSPSHDPISNLLLLNETSVPPMASTTPPRELTISAAPSDPGGSHAGGSHELPQPSIVLGASPDDHVPSPVGQPSATAQPPSLMTVSSLSTHIATSAVPAGDNGKPCMGFKTSTMFMISFSCYGEWRRKFQPTQRPLRTGQPAGTPGRRTLVFKRSAKGTASLYPIISFGLPDR